MSWLSQQELGQLVLAESMPALPIPTRPVSSDEFMPAAAAPMTPGRSSSAADASTG